jgi:hypothetical protein
VLAVFLELKDSTMTEIEITTGTEAGNSEPRLTLTELRGLLRDAAALERAQRPIVVRPSTEAPVTVPPTGAPDVPAHAGIDVTMPAVVEYGVGWAVLRHRPPSRRPWGVRLAYASMLTALAGVAAATMTDGNAAAVGVCATGLAGVIGGIARTVTEQNRQA